MSTVSGRPPMPRWAIWARAGYVPEHVVLALLPALCGAAAAGATRADAGVVVAAATAAVTNEIGGRYVNYQQDLRSGVDDPAQLPTDHPTRTGYPTAAALYAAGTGCLLTFGLLATWISWQVSPWLVPLGPLLTAATFNYAGGAARFGHRGLAEIGRFCASGLMAGGTAVAVTGSVEATHLAVGGIFGGLAVAGMTVQNRRDAALDAASGKLTLPARSGPGAGATLVAVATLTATACGWVLAARTELPWLAVTAPAALGLNAAGWLGTRLTWGWYVHPRLTVVVYVLVSLPLLWPAAGPA